MTGLVALSGLLTALSFDFPRVSFLAWFSLVPFFYVINRSKIKRVAFYGFLFGIVFYGASIFWVGKVTNLGLIFLLFYLSLYYSLFALLGKYFFKKPLAIISIPCLWVILEYLKENIWCGFGWANLGYSQYQNLHLIQVADLWGVKFISFLLVMGNILLYELGFRRKSVLRKIIFVFLIIFSCIFYSAYKIQTLEAKDYVDISLIQPNISEEEKWNNYLRPQIIERFILLSKEAEKNSLVIFPEAAWPYTLDKDNFNQLQEFIKRIEKKVLIGSVVKDENKFYNTALLFDAKGKLLNQYRKIKLVPFGEYIPSALRKYLTFIEVINLIGDMSRGKHYEVFSYRDKKFGVLICFEDIFPSFVSRVSRNCDFMINITNDAWFGGEPEASQHLSIMVMRAIENRISIIRCANTGISGWVSFKGEIEQLKDNGGSEVFFEATANYRSLLNKEKSFYNKYGESTFMLFCGLFLLGVIIRK